MELRKLASEWVRERYRKRKREKREREKKNKARKRERKKKETDKSKKRNTHFSCQFFVCDIKLNHIFINYDQLFLIRSTLKRDLINNRGTDSSMRDEDGKWYWERERESSAYSNIPLFRYRQAFVQFFLLHNWRGWFQKELN